MDAKEQIEEAHGLWELAAARLSAFVECRASEKDLALASFQEREAFRHWQDVSRKVLSE